MSRHANRNQPEITADKLVEFITTLKLIEQRNRPGKTPVKLSEIMKESPAEVDALFEALMRRIETAPDP
jgi:hypothetical protein